MKDKLEQTLWQSYAPNHVNSDLLGDHMSPSGFGSWLVYLFIYLFGKVSW